MERRRESNHSFWVHKKHEIDLGRVGRRRACLEQAFGYIRSRTEVKNLEDLVPLMLQHDKVCYDHFSIISDEARERDRVEECNRQIAGDIEWHWIARNSILDVAHRVKFGERGTERMGGPYSPLL